MMHRIIIDPVIFMGKLQAPLTFEVAPQDLEEVARWLALHAVPQTLAAEQFVKAEKIKDRERAAEAKAQARERAKAQAALDRLAQRKTAREAREALAAEKKRLRNQEREVKRLLALKKKERA